MNSYILIGAGGTGSHFIAPALAYLETHHRNRDNEEWQFAIVDGDNYDIGNLERQLFEPGYVTANKAEAMARMYNRFPVIAVPKFIGKVDLAEMMQEGDTVFIAADNHSVRALVAERAAELPNVVVINAGNELSDGNVQLYVRENGQNATPPITFMHPEIHFVSKDDRAAMTCAQAAALPGGGQLILANQQAAAWMLAALWRFHTGEWRNPGWTELQFDLAKGQVNHVDMRTWEGWVK